MEPHSEGGRRNPDPSPPKAAWTERRFADTNSSLGLSSWLPNCVTSLDKSVREVALTAVHTSPLQAMPPVGGLFFCLAFLVSQLIVLSVYLICIFGIHCKLHMV